MHNAVEVEATVKFKLTSENGDVITVELNRSGAESLVNDLKKALGLKEETHNHWYYRSWPIYFGEPLFGSVPPVTVKPMITWNSNTIQKQSGNISCNYAGMGM